jgi:carboxyl-terminal processing protease
MRYTVLATTISAFVAVSTAIGGVPTSNPPVALLYHNDHKVRIGAIQRLAAEEDSSFIDDLIRAKSVENYTPVHNAYRTHLLRLADLRSLPDGMNWKAWLAAEVEAGRLEIDYLPVDTAAVDESLRSELQPFASQAGPEKFDKMTRRLMSPTGQVPDSDALRYLVANDHLPEIQKFLAGDWLTQTLGRKDVNINTVAYHLNGLADPGPLRDKINASVIACLQSDDVTTVAKALNLIAGVDGFSTVFRVPNAEPHVRKHLESQHILIAEQAERAMKRIAPEEMAEEVTYAEAFRDLYRQLGRSYPCFQLKDIDWQAVGDELLPRAEKVETDDEFGLLCLELVARLEDSHAALQPASARLPQIPFPQWDPGFACLLDDKVQPVVYYVDRGSPAEKAGIAIGMAVTKTDGVPADKVMESWMEQITRYVGYSSRRYLRYQAARMFCRQMTQGQVVNVEFEQLDGEKVTHDLPCTLGVRYLPRLPVPITGIADAGNVSWTMLDDEIGYVYVRRIRGDLPEQLDRAVAELKEAKGIIVDVRGNSGGGFDASRAYRNFEFDDDQEPHRPRFHGPMALLLDARCISAGEGWASWFIAEDRAQTFGETTAGASARKTTYPLKNGLYRVRFPVKAYTGFLDRPIERRGLEPKVRRRQEATALAAGRDTVLEAAREYLLESGSLQETRGEN